MAHLERTHFESFVSLSMNETKQYMIADRKCLRFFDQETFKFQTSLTLDFPEFIHDTTKKQKMPLQILSVILNTISTQFGVLIGVQLSEHDYKSYYIHIFSRMNISDWQFHKQIKLDPDLRYICKQFEFKNKNRKSLLLCTHNCFIDLNFETMEKKVIYELNN